MSSDKKNYYGKEVTDAIKSACEDLDVSQEMLDIEVISTGSTGIFGLIRKKAHIKVTLKVQEIKEVEETSVFAEAIQAAQPAPVEKPSQPKAKQVKPAKSVKPVDTPVAEVENAPVVVSAAEEADSDSEDDDDEELVSDEAPSDEVLGLIKNEFEQLITLMGCPSEVTVSANGSLVECHVGEEYESYLTGQEGKTLDAIQYLLRKIVARKVPNRIRLMVDVGNYRERRLEELKTRALDLAEKVKLQGKTQIIPALSPSERRVVHMCLQNDKEIRSRSVGDGLFKKILIYLPGKGSSGKPSGNTRGSGRRRSSRGRRNGNSNSNGNSNKKKSE